MRFAQIRDFDIVNGQGIAVSLFVQGCNQHCKGCFNKSTWDFDSGKEWNQDIEDKFIELCQRQYVSCVSFLGGDPLDQPQEDMIHLLKRVQEEVKKPIFMWTGHYLDDEINNPVIRHVDYLIDGDFQEDKKESTLKLRGSSNQKIWYRNGNVWTDITELLERN